MRYAVYVSHADEDKSIADAICGKLESAHLKCWKTTRGTAAREDWREPGRKAIASSRVIVLVLSDNANAAPHLEREIAHAFSLRRVIVPFRLAATVPRPEIMFYLGHVPWLNVPNPPGEEHLEALTARIKELMAFSARSGDATSPQGAGKNAALFSPAKSWFGDLKGSDNRTLGILKWVSLTTFLAAGVLFLWFTLRQTREWASLAESRRRSMDVAASHSPTPSPLVAGDALTSKQALAWTPFGWWQAAKSSHTPLVQGPPDPPSNLPAESANATSPPQPDVAPEEQAAGLAPEPDSPHLPLVTHRVSHDHRPPYPGTQVKEARKIADLKNQRDSLRSQLKDTEANVLAMQKTAERVTSQRDELRTRLSESEEKRQIGQEDLEILARDLEKLRNQLKESESRALTAEKNEEFLRSQLSALQTQLQETEGEAQAAQKNADLATSQRDALQSEIGELRERAQRAETNGQSEEVRQEAQPPREDVGLAQTQPPNPGHNVKPAPLTQTLDSFVQPAGHSGN